MALKYPLLEREAASAVLLRVVFPMIHQQKKFSLMYYLYISLNMLVLSTPLVLPIPPEFISLS
jgi:hypothetical protein